MAQCFSEEFSREGKFLLDVRGQQRPLPAHLRNSPMRSTASDPEVVKCHESSTGFGHLVFPRPGLTTAA